ncbi:hypothetical protein C8R44DRAFT_880319 [Mycena epipterygia]|nr:hypothetical protein C8R44DRAFT_880319 [Mycena epipterygia]
MSLSTIHAARAKRWKTNPFIAEWLAIAVEYCKNHPEGMVDFRNWLMKEYGPYDGQQKIETCKQPPRQKYGTYTGNAFLWNSAGVELGACDEAIQLYHKFTSQYNICVPPRTKPAPKRKRAENAIDWLARRHEALLEGCKAPNSDWEVLRAIAISEPDKVRDTMEMWRTDPETFMHGLIKRGESTIPSPGIDDGETADGLAMMEEDKAYTRRHGHSTENTLDQFIVMAVSEWGSFEPAFFDNLSKILRQSPSEAKKFSAEAFNEIGDYAIIHEFRTELWISPFGQQLQEYAASKEATRLSDPNFEGEASFVDVAKLPAEERTAYDFSTACVLSRAIAYKWLEIVSQQSLRWFIPQITLLIPSAVDEMWQNTDRNLWAASKMLDKRGSAGAVAKRFGLINPDEPNRLTFAGFLFNLRNPPQVPFRIQPATTPAPARTAPSIPVAGPRDPTIFHRILEDDPNEESTNPDQKKGQVRWGDFERAMKRVGFEVMQTAGSRFVSIHPHRLPGPSPSIALIPTLC